MSFDIHFAKRIGKRDIAVEIACDASLVAVVGPSGVGKTTALNCIAGLLRPESGRIAIDGQMLFDSDRHIDLPPERRRCGYVFQDCRLFPHLTVEQNLGYGEALTADSAGLAKRSDLIELFDIAQLLERRPATLSGGETRRVAIARALLSAPRFLLLDEPLASLDQDRSEQVLQCIERVRDGLGIPILYVSHNAAEVTRLTDRVVDLAMSR